MTDVNRMLNALDAVLTARMDLYKARDEDQGYSWDYAGVSYTEAVDIAEKEYESAFRECVNDLIEKSKQP